VRDRTAVHIASLRPADRTRPVGDTRRRRPRVQNLAAHVCAANPGCRIWAPLTRRRAQGAGQDLRVPLLPRRGPRVLLGEPPRLPSGSRRRRLGEDLHLVRPLPRLL